MIRRKPKEERRVYIRGNLHFLIRYKTDDGKAEVVSSINLCAGGALLRTRKECKIGQRITLLINFINHPSREIFTEARVVRVQKHKNYFKTAIEFIKISTEDKDAIVVFVHALFGK